MEWMKTISESGIQLSKCINRGNTNLKDLTSTVGPVLGPIPLEQSYATVSLFFFHFQVVQPNTADKLALPLAVRSSASCFVVHLRWPLGSSWDLIWYLPVSLFAPQVADECNLDHLWPPLFSRLHKSWLTTLSLCVPLYVYAIHLLPSINSSLFSLLSYTNVNPGSWVFCVISCSAYKVIFSGVPHNPWKFWSKNSFGRKKFGQ